MEKILQNTKAAPNSSPVFLREATQLNSFQKGKFNFVFADVGAGKTTFVGKSLVEQLDYEGAFIFLSPYNSLKHQVIEDELFENESLEFRKALQGFVSFNIDEIQSVDDLLKHKKVVLTAQAFFWYAQKHPSIWDNIGVLVIDEVDHVLFTLPNWGKNPKDPFRVIQETLTKQLSKTFVIGLTATNKDRLIECWKDKTNIIKFKEPLRELVPSEITPFSQLYLTIDNALTETKITKTKIAIFTKLVSSAIKIKTHYIEKGYSVDVLVSDTAKHYKMSNREAALKRSIEQNGNGDFGDILIFNSTLERGVSITDKRFSHIIVNNSNEITQTQVIGRFRYSGIKAFCLEKTSANKITGIETLNLPEKYLNVELSQELIQQLVQELNLTDDRGRPVGWNTTLKHLSGYTIEKYRKTVKGKKLTLYRITIDITV